MYFLADFASYKNNIEINGLNEGETILLNCEGYLVDNIVSLTGLFTTLTPPSPSLFENICIGGSLSSNSILLSIFSISL